MARRESERSYYSPGGTWEQEIDASTGDGYYQEPGPGPGTPTQGTRVSYVGSIIPQELLQAPIESDPMDDYLRMQQELADAQRRSRIAALDQAKTGALSALDTEQARVPGIYQNKRNQAAAASDVGALNFANYMATRGIRGPAGAMPEIHRQAALQSRIGALDQSEASNMAEIERQRGLIDSNYAFDVAQANADIDSQAMQNQIDAFWKNRERQDRMNELRGYVDGQPTMARQQMESDMTGYYNPWAAYALTDDIKNQLAPYMGNLAAWIDANPDSPLVPYAQNLRYDKIMNDPTLKEKYGSQYQTVQGIQTANQNKLAELDIAAKEIENSYLPETLKQKAKLLMYQVQTDALNPDIALAQLNQIKAETYRTLHPVRSGGSGTTENRNLQTQTLISNVLQAGSADEAYKYLQSVSAEAAADGANIDDVIKAINARWPKESAWTTP